MVRRNSCNSVRTVTKENCRRGFEANFVDRQGERLGIPEIFRSPVICDGSNSCSAFSNFLAERNNSGGITPASNCRLRLMKMRLRREHIRRCFSGNGEQVLSASKSAAAAWDDATGRTYEGNATGRRETVAPNSCKLSEEELILGDKIKNSASRAIPVQMDARSRLKKPAACVALWPL